MESEEIRKKFLEFFEKKGHVVVPSSSLLSDDPSVLLTTAGMQQFKKYFTGELNAVTDFGSSRVTSIQKCFRTSDIEEVGDNTHLTFLEMMGNFSFGPLGSDNPRDSGVNGYFKRSAIHFAFEFLIDVMGISMDKFSVTVFEGDGEVPFDRESYDIWHKEIGINEARIRKCGRKDNFWGPTGNEGPCGPTTELYVDGIEVWNLVFNEYFCNKDKTLTKLKNQGIDTGMGFERLTAVLQGVSTIYETDIFKDSIKTIGEHAPNLSTRIKRIFADHLRSISFLVVDGVRPSNKEAGYVLRRLIRRILAYKIQYDIHGEFFLAVIEVVSRKLSDYYANLKNTKAITDILTEEKMRFEAAIRKGLKALEEKTSLDGREAFYLYETFGLPFDVIKELAPRSMANDIHYKDFELEMKKHQEVSRKGQEKKFGGHGLVLDTGELKARDEDELQRVLRLHTATHLLQQALRDVLGDSVRQAGSDITAERTRFDLHFNRKMREDEIKKVEDIVNKKIEEDLPVSYKEMSRRDAERTGALHFFKQKYPDHVKVYFVGHSLDNAYSKEFCGGPHVDHTGSIKKIKIIKEEAVAAGIRRIRVALVE